MSFSVSPVEAVPLTTDLIGTPLVWAIINDVTLLNPNWNWPLNTPGMIAAPPWAVSIFRSMPRLLKNPFFCPRYTGCHIDDRDDPYFDLGGLVPG